MLIEVKVPVLSESVSEATLSTWMKHPGEFVYQDENLVDLETDKVVLEIPAPDKGLLTEIKCGDGVNVTSNEVIAVIDTDATDDAGKNPVVKGNTEGKPAKLSVSEASVTSITKNTGERPVTPTHNGSVTAEPASGLPDNSPAVRKLISEYDLDPASILGTGKDGRLTKHDVIKHIKSLSHRNVSTELPQRKPVEAPMQTIETGDRPEKRVPMSRLRARVAERLKDAQNTAAILTTFNEVNMKPVMEMRNKYKDMFEKKHGIKLGFMSFFVRAAVEALKQYPVINASVDGNDIIYHGYYDIGIAVGSPRGLVVPVLRDVDQLGFSGIEGGIKNYGQKARDGKLSLEDLTGGTFSISNGGVYGSMLSTPILNPPQSAILGMHNIQERPVVEKGEIVVRPVMYLALSYDHRIIDGHEAVMFLIAIKEALEDPARMLLDV